MNAVAAKTVFHSRNVNERVLAVLVGVVYPVIYKMDWNCCIQYINISIIAVPCLACVVKHQYTNLPEKKKSYFSINNTSKWDGITGASESLNRLSESEGEWDIQAKEIMWLQENALGTSVCAPHSLFTLQNRIKNKWTFRSEICLPILYYSCSL